MGQLLPATPSIKQATKSDHAVVFALDEGREVEIPTTRSREMAFRSAHLPGKAVLLRYQLGERERPALTIAVDRDQGVPSKAARASPDDEVTAAGSEPLENCLLLG